MSMTSHSEEEAPTTCPTTNSSEVRRLLIQIETEHLAGKRAMYEYATTASHLEETTLFRLVSQPLTPAPQGVEVFFSYSHKDIVLRNELEKYLSSLKRQSRIISWHDGEIGAGKEWDREIEEHIDRAHVILLLIRQDFIASDYCYEREMKRALERHKKGEARVVPIILRPAHWEVTPFGMLQALPTEAKPVTLWKDRDEAFLDVVRGIQKVVDKLTTAIPIKEEPQ